MFPMLHGVFSQGGLVYLHNDLFTTAQSPAVDGNAEPIGYRDFVDPNGRFSVATGLLVLAASGSAGDTYLSHEKAGGGSWAHSGGWAIGWLDLVRSAGAPTLGIGTAKSISPGYQFEVSGASAVRDATNTVLFSFVTGNADRYLLIRDTSGRVRYIQNNSLLWISNGTSTAAMYSLFTGLSIASAGSVNDVKVVQLPAPYATSTGDATTALTSPSDGATFTHEGNTHILAYVTTIPSAGTFILRFREQDANNYWRVTVNSSGNIGLDEVVAGTPTSRGTSAGTMASGRRLTILCNGTTIAVYERTNRRINYTSASNFQTETDGQLEALGTSGAVSSLESYAVSIPAGGLAVLDSFFV